MHVKSWIEGLLKAMLWLNKCVTHMYGTEVPDSIRFCPPQEADAGGHCSPKSHLGGGVASVCLNACVIKGTLGLPRLQLPDAKASMNDFNWAEGENGLLYYYDSPSILCITPGRRLRGAHFDLICQILISYRF